VSNGDGRKGKREKEIERRAVEYQLVNLHEEDKRYPF